MIKRTEWLEDVLTEQLRPVETPGDLWDRIQNPRPASPRTPDWRIAWALAAALCILAVIRQAPRRGGTFESSDPASVRVWAKQRTGLDIPLPPALPPDVRLVGVRVVGGGLNKVEVAYRVKGYDARLIVSKQLGDNEKKHRFLTGQSWTMGGQLYVLASVGGPGLEVGCILCHA